MICRRHIHPLVLLVTLAVSRPQIAIANDLTPESISGAYFGLKIPGETPELFAPGIMNLPGRSVGRIAFSANGTECAFTVFEGLYANTQILFTRYENGAWTPPKPWPLVEGRETLEPLFSRDNRQLYFTVKSAGDSPNTDIWATQRTSEGWSLPAPLPAPFNSDQNEFCLAEAADGTMYFASARAGGLGGLDIYRTIVKSGQSVTVENLAEPVNSNFDDGDPALSPDGRILVFYSVSTRPRPSANSDLFICFADGKGGWTQPHNMGEGFNTPAAEYAGTFSLDGRVLFFTRFDGKKSEVYWVSTGALERFRNAPDAAVAPLETAVAPERKMVAVPTEILRRYVGTYTSPGLTAQITLEADQLMMQIIGQPKVSVYAESETKFFLKVVEAEIEFVRNEKGEITALIIHQAGMHIEIPRTTALSEKGSNGEAQKT